MAPAFLSSSRTLLFLKIALLCAGLYLLWDGAKEAWDLDRRNDLDVIRMGAREAWRHNPDLYRVRNERGRHFLYPPTGAVLMMPLCALPYRPAGVLLALARIGLLAALFAVMIRWIREAGRPLRPHEVVWAVSIATAIVWRYLRSEVGNGQINVLLSAFTVIGLYVAFSARAGRQWLGGLLVAVPVAIKAAPVIFLALLLLQKRWRSLAGGLVFLSALSLATVLWFGPESIRQLATEFRWQARQMALGAVGDDYVTSIPEFVVSVASSAGVEFTPGNIQRWWLAEAMLVALAYLILRWALSRRFGTPHPLWETAVFAILALLLSPLVRKAHVVLALFPVLVATACVIQADRIPVRRPARILFWIAAFLLCLGPTLPFESTIPGYPVNPLPCMGLLLLFGVLAALYRDCLEAAAAAADTDSEDFSRGIR